MGASNTAINIEFGKGLEARLRAATGKGKLAAFVRAAVEEKLGRADR
jgi:hypothetical protein